MSDTPSQQQSPAPRMDQSSTLGHISPTSAPSPTAGSPLLAPSPPMSIVGSTTPALGDADTAASSQHGLGSGPNSIAGDNAANSNGGAGAFVGGGDYSFSFSSPGFVYPTSAIDIPVSLSTISGGSNGSALNFTGLTNNLYQQLPFYSPDQSMAPAPTYGLGDLTGASMSTSPPNRLLDASPTGMPPTPGFSPPSGHHGIPGSGQSSLSAFSGSTNLSNLMSPGSPLSRAGTNGLGGTAQIRQNSDGGLNMNYDPFLSPGSMLNFNTMASDSKIGILPSARRPRSGGSDEAGFTDGEGEDDDPLSLNGPPGEMSAASVARRRDEIRRARIQSEQRRRDELRDGFRRLKDALPSNSARLSKSGLLTRAIAHIKALEAENDYLTKRCAAYEGENQQLRRINEAIMNPSASNISMDRRIFNGNAATNGSPFSMGGSAA